MIKIQQQDLKKKNLPKFLQKHQSLDLVVKFSLLDNSQNLVEFQLNFVWKFDSAQRNQITLVQFLKFSVFIASKFVFVFVFFRLICVSKQILLLIQIFSLTHKALGVNSKESL